MHSLAGPQLLRQLAELSDVDAVVSAFVAAAPLAVVRADVDEDVVDASRVGILENHGAVTAERHDTVGVVPGREPLREMEACVDENTYRLIELVLGGSTDYDQSHGRDSSVPLPRSARYFAASAGGAKERVAQLGAHR